MSVNKVIILGNLGKDPEVRYSADGSNAIANLTVATSRKYKNKQGEVTTDTEWHKVSAFGRTAENMRDYLKKGSKIYIEGRLRTRKYQDRNGQDRSTTEIVCESMQLLDKREDGQAQPRQQQQQGYQPSSNPYQQKQTSNIQQVEDDVPF